LSAEQDKIRSIADRIAQRLAGGGADVEPRGGAESDELTQLRAALRELQQRLAHVESHVAHGDDCAQHAHGAGAQAQQAATSSQGGALQSQQQQQQQQQQQRVGQQFLSSTYVPAVHPSQERFGIDEAVSELVDFFEREKVCSVEPGGKPCDQCGMCSSRGF
jgi:hypothetical protein